ncbi:ABC transporter permease subunit [Sphingomonas sp. ASV193]|uniref:ABC transporter permease n=1 Tax=Sphingomonas sp. ASV193 TaxID=3144405 RepID=UPI0032E9186E
MSVPDGLPQRTTPLAVDGRAGRDAWWADLLAFLVLATIAVLVFRGGEQMARPLSQLAASPVALDPANLPGYALRTTLRMLAAMVASLLFTFVVATLAAKSRRAEMLIVPALDILQSVPVLGFLTFTVTLFMGMFPGSQLGVECAAIFAIFTAQAWNMAFSVFQSIRTIPSDLDEVARQFRFSAWRRFVRLELPFAVPGLVWNMMMSMSGSWFFVVASEAITVGKTTVALPGIGSYLALAIGQEDFRAVAIAVAAMAIVILLYDQLLFRPIVAWADRFRFEQTASGEAPKSWVYDLIRRSRFSRLSTRSLPAVPRLRLPLPSGRRRPRLTLPAMPEWLWRLLVALTCGAASVELLLYLSSRLSFADLLVALGDGSLTLLRVVVLIALASLVWVPVGVWIGLRPGWASRVQALAQFLAAFPANVLFPVAVIAIVHWHLSPDIWLSPLMVLGTQWYILFNVIAGASVIPTDMKEVARIYGLRGWQRWRQLLLPAIFPYYVTGALTASGGSWNASIVAEAVSWGRSTLTAHGLGAYIAAATTAGDFPRVALGIAVMSAFVVLFNRTLWRPLYRFAERRLRLD